MKARIIEHNNPKYIGMICDVVYYDFDEKTSKVIFKTLGSNGDILELFSDDVRIVFENFKERMQLECYVFEKAFTHL